MPGFNFTNTPALIINLSSLLTWQTGKKGEQNAAINAFTHLCRYCSPLCTRFPFLQTFNSSWVKASYLLNLKIINQYKLGKMDTVQFFNYLLNHTFYFMRYYNFTRVYESGKDLILKNKIDNIKKNSNKYLTLRNKNIASLDNEDLALALLEDAWNAALSYDEQSAQRCQILKRTARDHPIILISNSNPSNINCNLCLLEDNLKMELNKDEVTTITDSLHKEPLIQIYPNIFLAVSYRFRCYKTDGLLNEIVKSYNVAEGSTLISQFSPDLVAGNSLRLISFDAQQYDWDEKKSNSQSSSMSKSS